MPDEFVKKEVFDARMDRMEALLEKTLIEMKMDNEKLRSDVNAAISEMKMDNEKLRSELKADNEKLRSEMKEEIAQLRGETREMGLELKSEIRALDARVDALQTWQYWQIAWIGILVAAVALIPAVTQYLRKKGEMTVERARDLLERFAEASAAVSGAQQKSL